MEYFDIYYLCTALSIALVVGVFTILIIDANNTAIATAAFFLSITAVILAVLAVFTAKHARAADDDGWRMTISIASIHHDTKCRANGNCNGLNPGIGALYRHGDWELGGHAYHNSQRELSGAITGSYLPHVAGPLYLGISIGAASGYRTVVTDRQITTCTATGEYMLCSTEQVHRERKRAVTPMLGLTAALDTPYGQPRLTVSTLRDTTDKSRPRGVVAMLWYAVPF